MQVGSTKIFTEEPEEELWRSLLRYSYKTNIKRYFDEHGILYDLDHVSNNSTQVTGSFSLNVLSNSISGALLQADEYYKAGKSVSLQVSPLLFYYGTTNLFYAMTVLLTGAVPVITNHGMRVEADINNTYIADTKIKFDHPKDGGIHIFAKNLGYKTNLCDFKDWTLGDFLSSIAEINDDFVVCYRDKQSHVVMIDAVSTPDGPVEKIHLKEGTEEDILSRINGFKKSYLSPQRVQNLNDSYLVLRHKMNQESISFNSYSGQPYFLVSLKKSDKSVTIPRELNMYISLFVLSSLCRYHPEIWNPFVIQDSTGEKLIVEKLLYYARRMLPNIVLNQILGKNISFVSDKYTPEDRIHLVGEHEVKEIVQNEVRIQLRQRDAENIVH